MILTIMSNEEVDIHYREVIARVAHRIANPDVRQSAVYGIYNDDLRQQVMGRLTSEGFYVYMLNGSRTVFVVRW